MIGINSNNLHQESGYRIRYQKSLIAQIEMDHADMVRLWEKQQTGTISTNEGKELQKIICWLKKELIQYEKIQKIGIEGLTFGRMHAIEIDLRKKEKIIEKINQNY